ncbi:MAG: glycosyltransferase [Hyphomicrobiales bacterium]
MNILFVHQNYPGQYRHLLDWLRGQGSHRIVFLTQREGGGNPTDHKVIRYKPVSRPVEGTFALSKEFEKNCAAGLRVAHICRDLEREGFRPDIVLGHAGWGETLFIKDVWPDVPVIAYFEYYYSTVGGAVGFDPEFPISDQMIFIMTARNATNHLALGTCDAGQTATDWQYRRYPAEFQRKITVAHEGIDTRTLTPDPNASVQLGRLDRPLTRADEVVTYVARNLEPVRGFHTLMRALPDLLERRPSARVIIVGGEAVSYGRASDHPGGYRAQYQAEVDGRVDWSRVHFLGQVPYPAFKQLLQVSRCHVYLSVPFVLSWSLIEAMSIGATIVASDVPSVREVITPGKTGRLVDFLSPQQLADTVADVLAAPREHARLGKAARQLAVSQYDLYDRCLPRQLALINHHLPRKLRLSTDCARPTAAA